MTPEEYKKQKSAMYQKYKAGEITNYAYIQWKKKNDPSLQGGGASALSSAPPSAQGMSHEEYIGLGEALNKKKKAGLITSAEYDALAKKLDDAYHANKTVADIVTEIGCDPGSMAAADAILDLGKEIKGIYKQAASEMQTKLDEFLKKYGPEIDELNQKAADGTITEDEAKRLEMLLLQKAIMGQKADQLAGIMTQANKKAMAMVNGKMMGVFAENAAWQSYQLTQDTKLDLMFSIYDEHTVEKLIRDKPELLPRKEVNGKKDQAWNRQIIANSVAQGILQGESIPKLARRIAADTGEKNGKAMMRYARTAMTSAQNSGRIEMLHRAEGMGIKVKKKWLATLDGRTRDSHRHMDGVTAKVDDDFVTPLGSHMKYPGDMSGDAKGVDIWNCRCTLVYEYEDYPADPTADMRRDNETGQLIANMTYDDWKAAKEGSVLNDLSMSKVELAEAQKEFIAAGVKEDKVYNDIWKDPVTLADYPDKAGSIQAKRDYYEAEIQKYKDAKAAGSGWATDEKIKELQKKLKLLNEFEKHGKLLQKRNAALKKVQDLYGKAGLAKKAAAPEIAKKAKKAAKKKAAAAGDANTGTDAGSGADKAGEAKKMPFGPDSYTKERKDKAVWAKTPREADGHLRAKAGEVWNKSTQDEKYAIYDYTGSYHKFNEPLRGIEYGTSRYLGVGNTDLNAGHAKNGKELNAMTDIIAKSTYDEDFWLQRGCNYNNMDKFFNVPMSLLTNGSQEELEQALLGTMPIEYGFMSCGSNKGSGLNVNQPGGILLNIYAPSGTQMMYVEPFSQYGGESKGMHWDGKSGQTHFGHEVETLVNQGTQFRVLKVERKGRTGKIYVDMEIINQDHQQRWKPKR